MESSGPTPPGAVRAEDVPDVSRAFELPGPFLSVVLTTEGAIPQAAQRSQLLWDHLRDEAAAMGADEDTLADIDPLVPDAHRHGEALAVVAGRTGVHVVDHGLEPPRRDHARWLPLPSVSQVLTWRQARVPYLIVNADRTGADLIVIGATADQRVEHAGGYRGPIHKPNAGGWSQRRYQQRAENTWEHNAADVAEHVTRLVDQHDLELVLVTGEVRALELLDESLPKRVRDLVRDVEGARTGDGSVDERSPVIVRHVASAVAERTVALLRKFDEEQGQVDRAANGPAATIAALARAQVDVLLVHDDVEDARIAFFGPKPLEVATSADELIELGVDDVREGRLVDVLLRAAFGSGAGVRITPGAGPLEGGVGGLLRWAY
ncbi:MAG: hypothetical protein QOI55_1631 [Actinomycetota bacterium]|nr:hypothetical protein [Actinomycetota bacterium]